MSLHEVSGRRKLAVWRTVTSCYATVLNNLGQLVRVTWLWLLVMVPVYAAAHWLVSNFWQPPGIPPMPQWVQVSVVVLPLVVELPFLASIAVAWHRLVLRDERVSAPAYLRLDTPVWLYALYSLGFLAVTVTPMLCAVPLVTQVPSRILLLIVASLIGLTLAFGLLVLPRLSLVLPALALGERLSLWEAWRATRGNTLRLALATCLCMLPAQLLILSLPLLSFLLWNPTWEEMQQVREWTTTHPPSLVERILDSVSYAVFNSLAYALLAIFAVTLLSLAYRFLAAQGREGASPTA